MTDETMETQQPQEIASETSQQAFREIAESAKLSAESQKVQFESLSELGNFLRQERLALEAMLKETMAIADELLQLQDNMNQLRDSLIQEYEVQQQITQVLQSEERKPLEFREQEPEQAQHAGPMSFLKNS